MRKNILPMAVMVLLAMASCQDSFLDQTATTDLNEETVFADSAYAAGFLTQWHVTRRNHASSQHPQPVLPLPQAL